MSARDDYPLHRALEILNGGPSALIELDFLRAWKTEALLVLNEWEAVWEAAGQPGPLGSSKARSTADEIRRLQTERRCEP